MTFRPGHLFAALSLLALTACGSPDYYLLPAPQAQPARLASPVSTVSVAEISLPAYAEAIEIATETAPGTLKLDGSASWADTPRRSLTRHLIAALEARLTAKVAAEPWPGFDRPGLSVEVTVDRLIGGPETPLVFSGQYVIVAPDSGRIFASERFAISVPAQNAGFTGLAAAHALAIERLADDIAARMAGRARPAA